MHSKSSSSVLLQKLTYLVLFRKGLDLKKKWLSDSNMIPIENQQMDAFIVDNNRSEGFKSEMWQIFGSEEKWGPALFLNTR